MNTTNHVVRARWITVSASAAAVVATAGIASGLAIVQGSGTAGSTATTSSNSSTPSAETPGGAVSDGSTVASPSDGTSGAGNWPPTPPLQNGGSNVHAQTSAS